MKFAIFFMGEYVAMFTSSAIIVTLFFGGYQIPWLSTATLLEYCKPVCVALLIICPVFMYFFGIWIKKNNRSHYYRVNDPRKKEASVYLKILWALVLIVEICLVILLLSSSDGPWQHVFVTLLQIVTFLVKTTFMCFVYVWVRWTLPRFRYDQLQTLGWKTLLPLSLLNIFVTSAIVVALA